jgi:hypothetical protein
MVVPLREVHAERDLYSADADLRLLRTTTTWNPLSGKDLGALHLGDESLFFVFDRNSRMTSEVHGSPVGPTLLQTSAWAARDVDATETIDGNVAVIALNDLTGPDRWWLSCTSPNMSYSFEPATQTDAWLAFVDAVLASSARDIAMNVSRDGSAHLVVLTNNNQIWRGDIDGFFCQTPPHVPFGK